MCLRPATRNNIEFPDMQRDNNKIYAFFFLITVINGRTDGRAEKDERGRKGIGKGCESSIVIGKTSFLPYLDI